MPVENPTGPTTMGTLSNESQYSIFYHAYNLDTFGATNSSNNLTEFDDFLLNEDLSGSFLLQFWLQGVGICGVSILGIIGNILSIIVLSHKRMRSSISFLLIGLAICDLIVLFNALLALGLPTVIQFTVANEGDMTRSNEAFLKFGHLVPFVMGVACTASTGSVFFTIAVTVERYLFICRPFLARRICTWKRAIQCSVAIISAAALMNLPRWWEYTCINVYDPADNLTLIGCHPKPSDLKTNPLYDYYFVHLFYLFVQLLGPVACISFVNALIYLKIKKANKNRKNLTISEVKENNLAYMLFIVVAVFVMSNILPLIAIIIKLTTGRRRLVAELDSIAFFLIVCNASVNFAIYCVYGEKFRSVFLDFVNICRCQQRRCHGSDISDIVSSQTSGLNSQMSVRQTSFSYLKSSASVKTISEEV